MGKDASERSKSANRVPKIKKTKNSIARFSSRGLIVYGKRKRTPTQRLVESRAFLKVTNRPKKLKKIALVKKAIKRMSTMQATAREGRQYLRDTEKMKRVTRSPAREFISKRAEKSRGRSRSKNAKMSVERRDNSKKMRDSKSPSRFLSRTRTMFDTLAASKHILKGGMIKGRTRSRSKSQKRM